MDKRKNYREYKAFISYRHLSPDKEIAKALQFLLEHNLYRPDKTVDRRIFPVFLDTSELPNMEDLDQGILDALDHSECLFVICSPNLPLSKYCMREIQYFKERHGGSTSRIYTVLVDGTPETSFPQILRTRTTRWVGEDGKEYQQEVDTEPLFSDVRGKNLLHSLLKLSGKEYIRLAAAYYRCSFDQLYKRQLRWRILSLITVAVLTILLCFGIYSYTNQMEADALAMEAEQILQEDDPLLAMTLCTRMDPKWSERYATALRSAVVQHHYDRNAVPLAASRLSSYLHSNAMGRYLSEAGDQIIIDNGQVMQITDAATGEIHIREARDTLFVNGNPPASYLILRSHENEQGVMMDYVSLMSLADNSLITEFSYRESSREYTDYELVRAIETDKLLAVFDGEEAVAFLNSDGIQLTKDEYVQQGLAYIDEPIEDDGPYRLVRKGRKYAVKNAQDEVVLDIGRNLVSSAFSDDWKLFAWIGDETIHVYDTSDFHQLAESPCPEEAVDRIQLLQGSSYYVGFAMQDGEEISTVLDWNTGKRLMTLEGYPLYSTSEEAFFVLRDGDLIRYDYENLDIAGKAEVTAHASQRCLLTGDGWIALMDTEQGTPLLEIPTGYPEQAAFDMDLNRLLVRTEGALCCYAGSADPAWSIAAEPLCLAMAEDGKHAAWLDTEGNVHLLNAADGTEKTVIPASALAEAGAVHQLAVSAEGLCAVGEKEVLWIPESGSSKHLGQYASVRLFSDGALVLEDADARIRDFRMYDTKSETVLYEPETNTGNWVYSPESGYLLRHVEESGNIPSLQIEIMKRKNKTFAPVDQIQLTQNWVESLCIDTTGQWLSIVSGGRTMVYHLKGMEKWLDADGSVYYEAGKLYGSTAYGNRLYSIPAADTEYLVTYAREALTGGWGMRTLSEAEEEQYIIQ